MTDSPASDPGHLPPAGLDRPSADSEAWQPAYPAADRNPASAAAPHPGTIYPPPGYAAGPTTYPPQEPPSQPAQPGRSGGQRRGGLVGGLVAAVIAFLKYGLIFFKFGKFGATAVSMLIALFAYAIFFGLPFAVGVVVLIFIHEMGHYLFSKALGVPVSAPLFIPLFGAFTTHKGLGKDRRVEAIIAIGGPLFGFAATLLLYLFALSASSVTRTVGLAYALSYFGFWITLLNLIPLSPLDGGRVAGAISKWTNVIGVGVFAALLVFMLNDGAAFNPFLLIVFLVGVYSVWNRFKQARQGREPAPLPASTRLWIGVAYIGLVAFSALGMSLAHGTLIDHGFVSSP